MQLFLCAGRETSALCLRGWRERERKPPVSVSRTTHDFMGGGPLERGFESLDPFNSLSQVTTHSIDPIPSDLRMSTGFRLLYS